jgi:hypothetical protein
MSASAYVDAGAAAEGAGGAEFLRWKHAQVAVVRRPACAVLAAMCIVPVAVYYAGEGSAGTVLDRFVGYASLGQLTSLGLCLAQAAMCLLLAILPPWCDGPSRSMARLHQLLVGSLVAICLLSSTLLCPSCLLSFAAAPPAHGAAHPAILYALSCFLLDPSLRAALPAAAATLAANACFIAYAPRDTAVYLNFMYANAPSSQCFCNTLLDAGPRLSPHTPLLHVGPSGRRRGAVAGAAPCAPPPMARRCQRLSPPQCWRSDVLWRRRCDLPHLGYVLNTVCDRHVG